MAKPDPIADYLWCANCYTGRLLKYVRGYKCPECGSIVFFIYNPERIYWRSA